MNKAEKALAKAAIKLAKKEHKRNKREDLSFRREQELGKEIDALIVPIVNMLDKYYKDYPCMILTVKGDGSWSLSKEKLACAVTTVEDEDLFDENDDDFPVCTNGCCCCDDEDDVETEPTA